MSLTTMQEVAGENFCQICGRRKAVLCYNAIICASCRVFFIRTSQKKLIFECKSDNNCLITSACKKCPACRYKKCLEAGMQPTDVGKRDRVRFAVQYINSRRFDAGKLEVSLYLLPSGLKNISRLKNASSAKQFAEILLQFESWASNMDGKSASDCEVDLNVNLTDILISPTMCASRESAAWDARYEINFKKTYSYVNSYCRFATMLSDFLNCVPEFHDLLFDDKIKCYQQSFSTSITMSMLYARWKLPYVPIKGSIVKRLDRFGFNAEEKRMFATHLSTVTTVYEKSVFPVFTELNLTDQEWILLKIICIFYSVDNCSEKGAKMFASLKTSYSSILARLIEETRHDLNEEQIIIRLGKILSVIRVITLMGGVTNQFHSSFITANSSKMMGNLSFDIHLRQM